MHRSPTLPLAGLLLVAGLFVAPTSPARADEVAEANLGAAGITWNVAGDFESAVLTVSRPDGSVVRKVFRDGSVPSFDLADAAGNLASDGAYTWQVTIAPRLDAKQKAALAAARRTNDPSAEARILAANGLGEARVKSGTFTVVDGRIVANDLTEPRPAADAAPARDGNLTRDVVVADDQIVQGSLCVGVDCVNGESFGFDTIRMKENNTRVKFDDTSSTGSFPSTDWQLTANDSASGGANKFSIEDITSAKVPFTITGGATSNSIFVDSTGRVGFRTATPVLDLHVATSNTPALRLEQTSAGGFTAQTWDMAGNEANFFVRDVTGGSRLPFRIRPGAPTSALDIAASGNVGIGTASPTDKLHVFSSASTGKALIENTNGTTTEREMLKVKNNGGALIIYQDTTQTTWSTGAFGGTFILDDQADAGVLEFQLFGNGNLTIGGTLTPNSSRTVKHGFDEVNGQAILTKVLAMPVTTWAYNADPKVRHMGPMAEDFYSAFELGGTDKGISVTDTAGVAFAAIQGLYQEVQQKNAALEARNAELETRLANLEKALATLVEQK